MGKTEQILGTVGFMSRGGSKMRKTGEAGESRRVENSGTWGPAPSQKRNRPLQWLIVRLEQFWNRENSLSVFCVLVVIWVIVAISVTKEEVLNRAILDVMCAMVLVSGVMAIAERRVVTLTIAALAALTVTAQVLEELMPNRFGTVLNAGASLLSLYSLAGVMLAHAFRAGPVTIHRVQGAVGAYLLLGLAWGHMYVLLEALHPGSFAYSGSPAKDPLLADLTYLSFTTLTTVGYGDFLAVDRVARAFCMSEGLIGQLYPAILIARLVSMELTSRVTPPVAPQ